MNRCAHEPCNRTFTSKRADARSCSAACRARASRERGEAVADPPPGAAPAALPLSPELRALERDLVELRRSIGALDPHAIAERAAEAARAAQPPSREGPAASPTNISRLREVAESARAMAESARMTAESARVGVEGARMVADAARERRRPPTGRARGRPPA